ncbi:hypothetical protein HMPREF3199_01726 [Enterococcus faecium]|nr:hypothetical protein HMPREF3199_01726 [Enterococcus faecium]
MRINGVQKLASAVISPAKLKTLGAVFTWLFLLLDAEQLFYNLSNKRCSISCPSILAQKTAKYGNYFSVCFSNTQVKPLISQPLIHGVPEAASTEIS